MAEHDDAETTADEDDHADDVEPAASLRAELTEPNVRWSVFVHSHMNQRRTDVKAGFRYTEGSA